MSRVKNLIRAYDGFTLDIPDWEIADEGVTALWGPSGSGKTTAFRLLIGLENCPGLSWSLGDTDLARLPAPERRLGVVFQTLELFPHLTARENILFAGRARKMAAAVVERRLRELSEDLQLGRCLDRPAHLLSGGEAQRVALARAVVAHPRFLFLDEPFSSLDSELKKEGRALVLGVIHKLKIPTLLITHDEEDLRALAQHVVKIRDGRLVL